MNDKVEIVKFVDGEFNLDVNISPFENTLWINIDQIALLFERDRSVISKHIKNIFLEGELIENSVCAFFAHTASDGKVYNIKYYNLDVVISVGYRVKSKRGVLFRKWAIKILNEYLLKGYVINENRVTVSNENYIALKNEVTSINSRLVNVENKLNYHNVPIEQIFYDGQFYDAYTLIQSFFEKAIYEIIIMDNYIDRSILDRLKIKKENVRVIIYTNIHKTKINENDIFMFNKQYSNLEVKCINNLHDRYIIIDRIYLYHIGASLKDLGNKIFSINRLDTKLIDVLLNKIKERDEVYESL